jgi:hypothetical protein
LLLCGLVSFLPDLGFQCFSVFDPDGGFLSGGGGFGVGGGGFHAGNGDGGGHLILFVFGG